MPTATQKLPVVPFLAGVIVVAAAAAVVWWRCFPTFEAEPTPIAAAERESSSVETPTTSGERWILGLDGWKIAVDGSELGQLRAEDLWSHAKDHWGDPAMSPYDQWIASYAQAAGLDWELVAAIIAEESNFDPDAVSDRGAVGLMQVRPIAAAQVGEEQFIDPESNIRTGVRYLTYLNDLFADVIAGERLPFVLAAYNMGPAHVQDARELARRLGFDPHRWHGHVARVLPLLELESVYRTLPAGYAQGRNALAYVERVLMRYQQLVLKGRGNP